MTRCLDEARLQSYFDGELSIELMESVTSHLASCVTCAAAARELEEETALLTTAFAAEFEASVPTERLRQRIDAAVLGDRVATGQATEKSGLAGFFIGLLSFGTQRTLGYASLAVVLAFAAIMGVVKLRTPQEPQQEVATSETPKTEPPRQVQAPAAPKTEEVVATNNATNNNVPVQNVAPIKVRPIKPSTKPVPEPVKFFPGERAYLQTIARLDSTIKSGDREMRPSLRAEYERNLAVVDRAIAATRSAAKSNPNDPDAADFMFAAYQSKVDLLNTIADARVSNGSRH
jgi:Putative zinc-finger